MAETTFFYNTGGRDEQMQLLLESRALKKYLILRIVLRR